MDADRLELGPVKAALLRRPGAPEPEGPRFADAAVELLDLPLPVGDEETIGRIGQALAGSCQALVLDLEEDALAEQLSENTQLPVVLASRAALVANTARVLLAVADAGAPLAELKVTTGGSAARAVGEVLLELGLPAANLAQLLEGSEPLPPGTDVLLVPEADCGKLAGSDEVGLEVGLRPTDEGVVLPALVRAAADAQTSLDVSGCAAVAQVLADLARGGSLPSASDPTRIPILAEAAANTLTGYRAALEELGSPLRRAVRDGLPAANRSLRRLVFVNGEAPATLAAARRLADEGLAVPILLGEPFRVDTRAREIGLAIDGLRVINPLRDKRREPFAEALELELGEDLGLDRAAALRRVADPLTFAALLVLSGEAQGVIAMSDRGDLAPLSACLNLLRRRTDVRSLHGAHLLATPKHACVVTDTACAADPTSEELAAAARHGAQLVETLLATEPRVAFVAHGSADAASDRQLHRLRRAKELVSIKAPDLEVRGPVEADDALAAGANVLIVPGRAAAQILVRSLQRLADAETLGPFLWGLRTPLLAVRHTVTASELELSARLACALSLDADQVPAAPSSLGQALREAVAKADAARAAEKAAQEAIAAREQAARVAATSALTDDADAESESDADAEAAGHAEEPERSERARGEQDRSELASEDPATSSARSRQQAGGPSSEAREPAHEAPASTAEGPPGRDSRGVEEDESSDPADEQRGATVEAPTRERSERARGEQDRSELASEDPATSSARSRQQAGGPSSEAREPAHEAPASTAEGPPGRDSRGVEEDESSDPADEQRGATVEAPTRERSERARGEQDRSELASEDPATSSARSRQQAGGLSSEAREPAHEAPASTAEGPPGRDSRDSEEDESSDPAEEQRGATVEAPTRERSERARGEQDRSELASEDPATSSARSRQQAGGLSSEAREPAHEAPASVEEPEAISSNEIPALEPSDPGLAPLPDSRPLIDLGPIPSAESFLGAKTNPDGKQRIAFEPKEDDGEA